MNATHLNRQLIIRLILLCVGLGFAIAVIPEMDTARTSGTDAQLARRQQLSVQLNAW